MIKKGLSQEEKRKCTINVLKLELDYHLMGLHDAIQDGDISVQEIEKRNLERIYQRLNNLGYFDTSQK